MAIYLYSGSYGGFTVGGILQLLGTTLVVLGLLDYISGRVWIDFTGVTWSPIALGIGGGVLAWIGGKIGSSNEEE